MLELEDLSVSFGEVVALDHLSFGVSSGQVVGFLGPNGAGKTTAMRVVMGIADPQAGRVTWRGEPIGLPQRLRFGYMPEERGLYPAMIVREQVVYLARLHGMTRGDAETATARWLDRLGIADRAGDPLEELSLGNQQRVQLTAALVHDPELLVLDEPFSGLDPIGVEAMAEVLRERAAAGVAVVFSSHQLDLVADVSESVVIIDHGKLVASGSVDDLTAGRTKRLSAVFVEAVTR